MGQRKKNQNKQNFKACKKPIVQQIQYTEELRIPTLATMDLRQAGRSIELKKSSSKKPGSRKSRCISVKQAGVQQPLKLKQLLKQFKSMKLIQDKSKSKSPRSSKSRPKTRKSTKKITQFNSKNSSELNLTVKLEKTIKKLKADNFFRDEEESQIPFVSTSEAYTEKQKKHFQFVIPENDDDINIREMRYFSKNSDQNCFRKNIQYFKGNIYDLMARRIQRAWKRFRTHKLVTRYANIFVNFNMSEYSQQSGRQLTTQKSHQDMIMIQSDHLYDGEMQQRRKVTYISNLQQEQQNGQLRIENCEKQQNDKQLKFIKMEQLQKWNEIISIISANKNDNPHEKQQLLKQLAIKSQRNKMSLEISRHNSGDQKQDDSDQIQSDKQEGREEEDEEEQAQNMKDNIRRMMQEKRRNRGNQQGSSYSEDSYKNQQQDEFNSKKYIEYLDSDMYPIVAHQDSATKICKEKQQLLLMRLTQLPSRRQVHGSKILASGHQALIDGQMRSRLSHRSISDFSIQSSQLDDQLNSERRKHNNIQDKRLKSKNLRKSTSEKIIKKTKQVPCLIAQKHTKGEQQQQSHQIDEDFNKEYNVQPQGGTNKRKEQINQALQEFMRKQFDQYQFQPEGELQDRQDLQKLYSEEQLTKKLAELKRLREDDSDEDNQFLQSKGSSQSDSAPILHRSNNPPLHRINIQDYDKNIESDEDFSQNDVGQKAQAISDLIFNQLMTQALRDMAKYPNTIIQKFKQFAVKKPKIKRAPSRPKKYGFVTNQAQIKTFIQELCIYVLNQYPGVFKNLEKATGPSALQMLRYMHQSADDQIYLDEEEDDPSVMVLPNYIFDNFWTRKLPTLKYEKQGIDEEREEQRQQYLRSLNKIFLRSCFDCLNQCLDFQRNFGSFGKPFPWKKSHLFEHVLSLHEIEKSVMASQKKLFQISCTYCGIIIEKEEMVSLCGSEQYVSQVQEDRLSRMLAQDLVQGEDRWIFYDDQETQLLVQCGNVIFYELLMEFYRQLLFLSK